MFNLEFFKANMAYGVAKPNAYDVLISSPSQGLSPSIGLVAEEAELPGKAFATRTMGLYGPAVNFAYQEIYTNLRMSFICSSDMYERKWFEDWHRKIVNPKSGFLGYYNTYVQEIKIRQLDGNGNVTYEGTATEAWPISIDNQQLSYRSQNEYHRLTVTFAYVRFVESEILAFTSGSSGVSGFQTPSRTQYQTPSGPGNPVAQ